VTQPAHRLLHPGLLALGAWNGRLPLCLDGCRCLVPRRRSVSGALPRPVRWGRAVGGHLSAVFVHANALHLLMNLLALWSLGRAAAESVIGWSRFHGGVRGFRVPRVPGEPRLVPCSGVPGGALLSGERGRLRRAGARGGHPAGAAGLGGSRGLYRALALAAVIGLLIRSTTRPTSGGSLSGVAIGYALGKERRPVQHDRLLAGVAAALLVACVVSVLLSRARSPQWRARASVRDSRPARIERNRRPDVDPDGMAPRWSLLPAWRSSTASAREGRFKIVYYGPGLGGKGRRSLCSTCTPRHRPEAHVARW
jgi:hypothetical protein